MHLCGYSWLGPSASELEQRVRAGERRLAEVRALHADMEALRPTMTRQGDLDGWSGPASLLYQGRAAYAHVGLAAAEDAVAEAEQAMVSALDRLRTECDKTRRREAECVSPMCPGAEQIPVWST